MFKEDNEFDKYTSLTYGPQLTKIESITSTYNYNYSIYTIEETECMGATK